jgi:AcrR family transcriptional regulator
VALLGAVVAYLFLPARARVEVPEVAVDEPVEELVGGAALRIGPEQRRGLAEVTLGLLAEAGMSSLTDSAVAARSGVGTATLQHYWTSRVDAVADAAREVFQAEHPVPDTGDLHRDLRDYARSLRDALDDPRARQVLGALVAEAASDPSLADTLRERVMGPGRAELAARLAADRDQLAVPVEAAVDMLVGPIHHRAIVLGEPVDDALLDAVVASISRPR